MKTVSSVAEHELVQSGGLILPSKQLELEPLHEPIPYEGPPWPAAIRLDAFHGLAGEIVRRIEPHSEADPTALLVQLLVAFGNAVGRGPRWMAESTPHFTNEFAVVVGQSSIARKGTSLDRILSMFAEVATDWSKTRIASGLVSGEGVVHAIRDTKKNAKGKTEDEGVSDKRLLVIEGEFAGVLAAFSRKENTLSAVLRCAWDGKTLRTLAKNTGEVATAPHVSLVAHITHDELGARLAKQDLSNGVANRFLWVCARRSKLLPEGGTLRVEDCGDLTSKLSSRLALANSRREVGFTSAAREKWHSVYAELETSRSGALGHVTSRAPAHVRRLALVYALFDGAEMVDTPQLRAALALWDYCLASADCIFGGLSTAAQDIHERLRLAYPGELTRKDLHDASGRHIRADVLTSTLTELARHGLATSRKEATGGAPRELWRAVCELSEISLPP